MLTPLPAGVGDDPVALTEQIGDRRNDESRALGFASVAPGVRASSPCSLASYPTTILSNSSRLLVAPDPTI
jgi:hypothetical protein